MSENLDIQNVEGYDIVKFLPKGVCSKLMQLKIKDNILLEMETVGGCSGNLGGISNLVKGMDINEIINKLKGIPCGSRPTSCPDQLAQGLQLYIAEKSKVTV